MAQIAIVFHSITGTTAALAEAVAEGVAEVAGAQAQMLPVPATAIVDGRFDDEALLAAVDAADALVMGSPTFMGGASAQFKAFADATSPRWDDRRWVGKLAAGFTIGGSINGDQTATLTWMWTFACQHGMLWAGVDLPGAVDDVALNRLGVQAGVSAHTLKPPVPARDLATARHLGRRVARLALALRRGREGAPAP